MSFRVFKPQLVPVPAPAYRLFGLGQPQRYCHRRRSGWTSGGRMASAEGGSVPSAGSGVWEGVSPLQPTKGSVGAS